MLKKIQSIHKPHEPHMVGDGLPVLNFFSYGDLGKEVLSPFLMLDYGFPSEFPPTSRKLGVGMHPHRGFETVTLVFSGGLEHKDTAGNHGEISEGDVQWMTAGGGVLHEEMHSKAFRETGGTLHMAQIWVNLPAKLKMTAPKYQTLLKAEIPTVSFDDGKARVRIVSGSLSDATGPADTNTPVNVLDLQLDAGAKFELKLPDGYTTAIIVLEGSAEINNDRTIDQHTLVVLDRKGDTVEFSSQSGAHVLVLNGEPIEEPVFGYGPFVMNSKEQIAEAISDFNRGAFAGSRKR